MKRYGVKSKPFDKLIYNKLDSNVMDEILNTLSDISKGTIVDGNGNFPFNIITPKIITIKINDLNKNRGSNKNCGNFSQADLFFTVKESFGKKINPVKQNFLKKYIENLIIYLKKLSAYNSEIEEIEEINNNNNK